MRSNCRWRERSIKIFCILLKKIIRECRPREKKTNRFTQQSERSHLTERMTKTKIMAMMDMEEMALLLWMNLAPPYMTSSNSQVTQSNTCIIERKAQVDKKKTHPLCVPRSTIASTMYTQKTHSSTTQGAVILRSGTISRMMGCGRRSTNQLLVNSSMKVNTMITLPITLSESLKVRLRGYWYHFVEKESKRKGSKKKREKP